jgi:hypothetical protein
MLDLDAGIYIPKTSYQVDRHQQRLSDVRLGHDEQRAETFTIDKMIHDICTHIWSIEILLKESMIISEGKGTLHSQRMSPRQRCFLFGRQLTHV